MISSAQSMTMAKESDEIWTDYAFAQPNHVKSDRTSNELAQNSVGKRSGRWTLRTLEGLSIVCLKNMGSFFIHKDKLPLIESIGPIQISQAFRGP